MWSIRLYWALDFCLWGVGDFCPFQMLLGRTCYSVINIPPELREINSPSEHVAMASAAQHGPSKLGLAASKWLRMLHCSPSPPFCSEASSFIRMSNFCLFALYINHHFYEQHRRMFSLPFLLQAGRASEDEVSCRAPDKDSGY